MDETIECSLFWEFFASHWKLHADSRYGLSGGRDGLTSRFGATYGMRVSPLTSLILGGEVVWASSDYMQPYFGVSSAQAAVSGLPEYTADQGLKEWNMKLTLRHRLTPKWTGLGRVGFKRLSGGAANSPLVTDDGKTPLFGQIRPAYQF